MDIDCVNSQAPALFAFCPERQAWNVNHRKNQGSIRGSQRLINAAQIRGIGFYIMPLNSFSSQSSNLHIRTLPRLLWAASITARHSHHKTPLCPITGRASRDDYLDGVGCSIFRQLYLSRSYLMMMCCVGPQRSSRSAKSQRAIGFHKFMEIHRPKTSEKIALIVRQKQISSFLLLQ